MMFGDISSRKDQSLLPLLPLREGGFCIFKNISDKTLKKGNRINEWKRMLWFKPIFLAAGEVESERITIGGQPRQKVSKTPNLN
jgi:hypothetical protein